MGRSRSRRGVIADATGVRGKRRSHSRGKKRGRAAVLAAFGMEQASRFVSKRLGEVDRLHRKGYVSGVADALVAWL